MRSLGLVALALFVSGCGPRDPSKVLVNGEIDVAPKQFAYKKFTLDLGGTYTVTLTPNGGDVEAWVEPGEAAPLVIYTANEKMPKAKIFSNGKEDTASGALGWGGAHLILFNRGDAAIRVKSKLTVVPTPLK